VKGMQEGFAGHPAVYGLPSLAIGIKIARIGHLSPDLSIDVWAQDV
jgi:hypothetical protein